RIAIEVLWTETILAIAADGIGTAGEEVAVRRHGRRVAERLAVGDFGVEHQRKAAPDRYELQIVVRRREEFHVAAGQRVAEIDAMTHAPIGKDGAIARIVAPTQAQLVRVELGTE